MSKIVGVTWLELQKVCGINRKGVISIGHMYCTLPGIFSLRSYRSPADT